MPTLSDERVRAVESLVDEWVHVADVPGASVVIVGEAGELYAEGFGARDLASNAAATPDTLYGMGSVTKSVTALAVLQLAERGALSVDDPVDDYIDHFADAPCDPITVRELLTHTSGMPATSAGLISQALDGVPAGVADEADRIRWIRAASDHRVTGEERFQYYNAGYDVLAAVLEAVDGRTYDAYVHDEVLDPLGMDRATFDREPFEADDDAMTPYRPGEDAPEEAPFPFDDLIRPSGGLLASTRELGAFLRAMLSDGAVDGTRLCEPETVERLQEPRATRNTFLDGREQRYGFGWMHEPLDDDALVGHGGSIIVSTAYAGFLDDAGIGVVVACNTSPDPHPMELGAAVLAVATDRDRTAVPAYALREQIEAVTGTYESFRGGLTATVERDGGTLAVTLSGAWADNEVTAVPTSLAPDVHEYYTVSGRGARVPLVFDLDGDRADLYYTRHRLRRSESGA